MRRNAIERLLPEVFRRTLAPGSPLGALLDVMEALHAPSEAVLADVGRYLSPYRAPDELVPFLARWVDLDRFLAAAPQTATGPRGQGTRPLSTGLGRLRELIMAAAYLSQWRGTARGLTLFLTTATGLQGFEIDEQVIGPDGLPRPFHIRVSAPPAAAPHRALIERIIEQEKPAYVTSELHFRPAS